ncbi:MULTISPECIES: D-aminoacyl-tRNA deacylase [Microvirgula]|uniref:D-aminoacyl-tRNA deacylase n=1 Tax=Microvirgula aerodenitrificans TaxID=57480 RepID=A0A2U3TH65_9NEIS|nr:MULTISPECIES: D-aminoacyl-tRNA deacylase [Microvirgula]AVY92745.1 D-tyrosyl-tRNA(Tyr) deacylase [Microvirgula aerodenitrificans]RAS17489.1 D-tyrosyl-tRNA(Tyr) deacylase [Microvirgula sp. AG722]
MRVLLQRVEQARVEVEERVVGAIGAGLLLLVGIEGDDNATDIDWLVRKLVGLRIFEDGTGKMNRSLADIDGQALAVSQFTLFASCRKGARPSWSRAAPPEVSLPLFNEFVARLTVELGKPVPTGVFGAEMKVSLVNDGPVTMLLDSRNPE